MAELFLAVETATQRRVVIKRILPYLSQEEEFVQMFLDEARIASQLHHRNIIQVYELGKLDQQIFLAMEYVEGLDLRRILQEEQKVSRVVPYRLGAFITARVCSGLFYAHNATGRDGKPMAIVHRDINPQNVMVGDNGEVKLVDFGIAKATAVAESSKPGVIKGKFLYLSPEQLSQERVDHRADLFALGTMLYEVTTGRNPFSKGTTEAVIYSVRNENPPPPEQLRPDYPKALSRIVMRCLAKDRARRYPSAEEIRLDLEEYLRTEERTDDESLRNYVLRLLGLEDESTVLVDPSRDAGRGVPQRISISRALTPAAPSKVVDVLPDPLTQAEGPLAKSLKGVGRAPTGASPRVTPPQEMAASPRPRPQTPSADAPRTGEVTFHQREPLPAEPSTTVARWADALAHNPLALGGLALVGVVLAGVLLYSLFAPPKAKPPPRPLVSRARVPPPALREADDAGAAVDGGGAAPVDAGAPPADSVEREPVREAPVTPRVMVQFKAPTGTLVGIKNETFQLGRRYPLPPGKVNVLYQCPAKRGKKRLYANLTVTVAPQPSGLQTVRLCTAK